jgi:serine/threonine protein kinase
VSREGTRLSLKPGRLLAEASGEPRWRAVERLVLGRSFDLWLVDDLHIEGHRAVAKIIRYANEDPEHVAARRALLDAERDLYLLPPTILPEPLDWLEIEGEPVLIYEYQSGDTLEELLRRRFPSGLGEARAARLVRELAHFAAEVHRAGFVLRDLSPGHVVVGLDDVLHVIGLGNAARAGKAGSEDRHKTSRTEGFSAPEALPGQPVHPSADAYSLGALLGWLASANPRARMGGPLGDLCATCLAADPEQRPNASEIYEALRRATVARPRPRPAPARPVAQKPLEGGPVPKAQPVAPRPAAPARPAPPEKRAGWRPPPWFWIALTFALAAGIATVVYFLRGA